MANRMSNWEVESRTRGAARKNDDAAWDRAFGEPGGHPYTGVVQGDGNPYVPFGPTTKSSNLSVSVTASRIKKK